MVTFATSQLIWQRDDKIIQQELGEINAVDINEEVLKIHGYALPKKGKGIIPCYSKMSMASAIARATMKKLKKQRKSTMTLKWSQQHVANISSICNINKTATGSISCLQGEKQQ
jgi:hypothetical protein